MKTSFLFHLYLAGVLALLFAFSISCKKECPKPACINYIVTVAKGETKVLDNGIELTFHEGFAMCGIAKCDERYSYTVKVSGKSYLIQKDTRWQSAASDTVSGYTISFYGKRCDLGMPSSEYCSVKFQINNLNCDYSLDTVRNYPAAKPDTFYLKFGQEVYTSDSSLKLKIVNIGEARCPIGKPICIQPGFIRIELDWTEQGKTTENYSFSYSLGERYYNPVFLKDYRLQATDSVKPYPVYNTITGQANPINKSAYVFPISILRIY